MSDPIRAAIEDSLTDGWLVSSYVCIANFQRINAEGLAEYGKAAMFDSGPPEAIEGLLLAGRTLVCGCPQR